MLGVVTCARAEDHARLHAFRTTSGIVAAPDPAWLMLRGMKTLAPASSANLLALEPAHRLAGHPAVERVRYPGLGDPVAAQYVDAFGPLLSFDVADEAAAAQVECSLRLIENATSLGGVASTLEARARLGGRPRPPGLLRLSVGSRMSRTCGRIWRRPSPPDHVNRPGRVLTSMKIVYTLTDEAKCWPRCRCCRSPIRAFASAAGIEIEVRDISLAGRILAQSWTRSTRSSGSWTRSPSSAPWPKSPRPTSSSCPTSALRCPS